MYKNLLLLPSRALKNRKLNILLIEYLGVLIFMELKMLVFILFLSISIKSKFEMIISIPFYFKSRLIFDKI